MTNKRMKTTVVLSLTLVLVILVGCNSKKGIESSKLGEKVKNQTKVLGVKDLEEDEDVRTLEKQVQPEASLQSTVKSEEFNKQQLQKATQHMKESFSVQKEIKEEVKPTLTKDDINSLKLSYENLAKYNRELEIQFSKYPNVTQEDYDNKLNIINNMLNEINNMNKIQNNSDEFKGVLVNTIEGLISTKNYIVKSRNYDLTSQQAVLVPELLQRCIDVYNDNMGSILSSIHDYVYSK